MRAVVRRAVSAIAVLVCVAGVGRAQSVRGVVVDPADRPVSGVVMILLDSASRITARALSDGQGEFRLTSLMPGTYRIRTTRIGFRPLLSGPITLGAGEVSTQRLTLAGIVFALDTVRAQDKPSCRMTARDSAAATWRVWEQVRAALTAGEITALSRGVTATTVNYQRTVELAHRQIVQQQATVRSEVVKQPWRSLSADSLRKVGYVGEAGEFTTYLAPGLDVLSSDTFLEDHCFRLDGRNRARLGVTFEPTGDRKKIPEIRGTAWLDRKTSELRSLEFRYVNVPIDIRDYAGGDMQFARMTNGAWAISRWSIRMPVIVQVDRNAESYETKVSELRVNGGELVLATSAARQGRDTLYARPPLILTGTVLDSVSGSPVRNAVASLRGTASNGTTDERGRFSIADVMPGNYTLEIRTPSLDSVNAVKEWPVVFTDSMPALNIRAPTGDQIATRLCKAQLPTEQGIVIGTVALRGSPATLGNVKVVAHWEVLSMVRGVEKTPRETDARTDSGGTYTLCGLPVNTVLTIAAETDTATSAPIAVRIPQGQRFGRADLTLDTHRRSAAVFAGLVQNDSTREPIANAEITLPSLSLTAISDARGEFRIPGITPGRQQVVVRHLGFGVLDTQLDFVADQTVRRTISLSRVTVLDSMLVNAAVRDPGLVEFEEHRARGFGSFITRDQIAKLEGASLAAVVSQVRGISISRKGFGSHSWLMGSRPPMSHCARSETACLKAEGLYYSPSPSEEADGIFFACYAAVYLDRTLMNTARPREPFDLGTIQPAQIEAIEWYTDEMQTPVMYMGAGSRCGTMVIHTRRSFGRDTPGRDTVSGARFTGVVLTDSTHLPIANAEVSLPILRKTALTNAKGEFFLGDIAPGEQQVKIRRLGYGVLDTKLDFVSKRTVDRTVYLSRVTDLDSVLVKGAARDPRMDEFNEHRLLGLGHFFTRDDIAKFDNGHLADLLAGVAGVRVVRGKANHAWVASSRGIKSMAPPPPDPSDTANGALKGLCYPQVYIDDVVVDGGSTPKARSPLFDINTMSPASIEAIELFVGPAQTPAKYMKLNSECGVMVIHTRR